MDEAIKRIELIVPCFNEEKCILPFYKEVSNLFINTSCLSRYDFLISYIDDGSQDNTVSEIEKVINCQENGGRVRYISFSRNFGKEAAIYAGLENSIGDYVVIMDADLQHPPSLIPKMLMEVNEKGYDCATARRVMRRGESVARRKGSDFFYKLFCKITGLNLVPGSTDYRLMKHKVVEAILKLPERERFTKGIYSWIGFKNCWIEYEDVERVAGETKWNIRGLIRYAYNGFVAFATTPLRAVIYFGMIVVILAIISAVYVYIIASINGTSANGFATIMIVMLLLNGVIITILGVIGEYLARIYMEVKERPIYIVREATAFEPKNGEDE